MRKDGIRVKHEDPMYTLIPQFLTKRYDSMNMITLDIPVDPISKYMNLKRAAGTPVSHLAVILAAYIRVVAEFPLLNRFVGNKKIYQHNDLMVSMVVLRPGSGGDTMSKIKFDQHDTIFDVNNKINEYISSNRASADNSLDKAMSVLTRLPGVISFVFGIIRFMDKHGILPRFLINASPFHASLLISNLASIRTNHIYHHIYEFGTTSIAITMGNYREVPKRTSNGIVHERCMPFGIVMDERICSGKYFARAFHKMKQYLANPELLESPPDFEVKYI